MPMISRLQPASQPPKDAQPLWLHDWILVVRAVKRELQQVYPDGPDVDNVDPYVFRNCLCNVFLRVGDSRWTFAEIQVHHDAILKYNNEADAHTHYSFFREYNVTY